MRAEPEAAADGGPADERGDGKAGLPGPGLQESLNPYAPPKASVELAPQAGLWRSGRLVRMDRVHPLPDRCVACNAPAGGYRLKRKLYYSPLAWKIGAPLAPFLLLLAAAWLRLPYLGWAFLPLLVILFIANFFVRKSLRLELGACQKHRNLRATLLTLSWLCMGGVFLGMFSLSEEWFAVVVLLGSIAGVLVLGLLQSYVGVQAVKLSHIDPQHAWLAGTGESFRGGLPELN